MELYHWDPEKNKRLVEERGISFEEIVAHIEQGDLLDVVRSRNERYKHQMQFVVKIMDYVYVVPFVDTGNEIFLKTIFPSRKMTKEYLEKGEN